MAGHRLAAAHAVDLFVGLALHADPRARDAERTSKVGAHLVDERNEFRPLSNDYNVDVHHGVAGRRDDISGTRGYLALTNTSDSNPAQITQELMKTVGKAVAEATKPKEDKVTWNPAWERFAGVYRSRGSEIRVLVMNERLVLMDPWAPSIEAPIELEPLGDGTFRMVAPTGGGPVGEIVRFVEENGEVIRIITGDSYADRLRN